MATLAASAPRMYDIIDVATLTRLSDRTIRRLYSAGEMPAPVRAGRAVRFRAADIDRWIAAGLPRETTAEPA